MQLKLIFIVCFTLILNGVKGGKTCNCNCCPTSPCTPILVTSFYLGEICNSTTCNQNACFQQNGSNCPAVGSSGIVYPICSHACSLFKHLTFIQIIISFVFFAKLYHY